MKYIKTIGLVIVALIVGYYLVGSRGTVETVETVEQPIAGISDVDGCRATTTVAAFNNFKSSLKPATGAILCGLYIHTATAANLTFMDATSTTDVASTSIANIPASLAAGQYLYGIEVKRGLFVESNVGTWAGQATITFK